VRNTGASACAVDGMLNAVCEVEQRQRMPHQSELFAGFARGQRYVRCCWSIAESLEHTAIVKIIASGQGRDVVASGAARLLSAQRAVARAGDAWAVGARAVGRRGCEGILRDFFTDGTFTPCGRPEGHFGEHFPVALVEDMYHSGAVAE